MLTQAAVISDVGHLRLLVGAQRTNFKLHRIQIAHDPCAGRNNAGCVDAGNGARVGEQGCAALDVGLHHDLGLVAVATADQVIIASAGHGVPVVRIVGDENAFAAQFDAGVHAVVDEFAGGVGHHPVQGHLITDIVAVNSVEWQADLESGAQGVRAYQVAAMNHCFRPLCMSCVHGRQQRFGAIMTIGNDADFQFSLPYREVNQVL